MEKLPKTKDDIQRLIIAELRTCADCEKAWGIIVVPVVDDFAIATWTVSRFHRGQSDAYACDRALQRIVPHYQRPTIWPIYTSDCRALPGPRRNGVTTLSTNSPETSERGSTALQKKEERLREGQQAMAEYLADKHAMRERTAKLRALRLARDAANHHASITPAAKKRSA